MNGIFTISLDFELHWGGFEKWPVDKYRNYFLNTRRTIPEMLELFKKYDLHVTWATVGMLFHSDLVALRQSMPHVLPTYDDIALSAYHYIDSVGIGQNEREDPLHYGLSLIQKIKETPHQEIGTHTFAHYYCNEPGQTAEQFRADLQAAKRAAAKNGIELKSLVFPRNQFNDEYLKICSSEGIVSVRSNPQDWFWEIGSTQKESLWKRLNRGLDAYFPVGGNNTYSPHAIKVRQGFPVCLPASRLLRPYQPAEFLLNTIKINRIKSEMTRAAKNDQIYHLWWHPHNFGNFPDQSLKALEKIVQHYQFCRKRWRMSSLTMNELASEIRDEK